MPRPSGALRFSGISARNAESANGIDTAHAIRALVLSADRGPNRTRSRKLGCRYDAIALPLRERISPYGWFAIAARACCGRQYEYQ
jgi:hypothetical protein